MSLKDTLQNGSDTAGGWISTACTVLGPDGEMIGVVQSIDAAGAAISQPHPGYAPHRNWDKLKATKVAILKKKWDKPLDGLELKIYEEIIIPWEPAGRHTWYTVALSSESKDAPSRDIAGDIKIYESLLFDVTFVDFKGLI